MQNVKLCLDKKKQTNKTKQENNRNSKLFLVQRMSKLDKHDLLSKKKKKKKEINQ